MSQPASSVGPEAVEHFRLRGSSNRPARAHFQPLASHPWKRPISSSAAGPTGSSWSTVAPGCAMSSAEPTRCSRGWRRLDAEHAVVLNPVTDELRMAQPVLGRADRHRVRAGGPLVVRQLRLGRPAICAALQTRTAGSRRPAPIAATGSPSRSRDETARWTRRFSSTASFPRPTGGTTSSSPEAG